MNCLKQLYFALVYPHLIYGLEIYGNTIKSYLDPLIKMNNKILRILLNKPLQTPINTLYTEFNTLPITALCNLFITCLVHKFVHHVEELPEIYQEYFTYNMNVHQHNTTRLSTALHVSQAKTNVGLKGIKLVGSKLWNELPETARKVKNPTIFKKLVKQRLNAKCWDVL